MLARILKNTRPGTIALILFLGLLLWLRTLLFPDSVEGIQAAAPLGPFHRWISLWEGLNGWPGSLLSLSLVAVIGFLTVRLNTTYNFIHERSFLPSLFLILTAGSLPQTQAFHPALIGAFFLLFALELVFATYRYPYTSFHFFKASLLIATGSLFYPPMVIFMFVVYIGIINLRTFNWREWITPVFGFAAPFLLFMGFYYMVFRDTAVFKEWLEDGLLAETDKIPFSLSHYVFFGYFALLLILSSLHMIRRFATKKVSSRIYLKIIFWTFLLSLGGYFLVPAASTEMMIFVGISVAYLFTTYFLFRKPLWWSEILLWAWLLALAFLQLFAYFQ